MIGRPPRSTLFPSPPLFRSDRFVRLSPPGPLELGASPSGEQIGGIGSGERLQPLRKTAHVEERSVQIEGHDREAHFGLTPRRARLPGAACASSPDRAAG